MAPVSPDRTDDQRFECSVHRCPHGCLHVAINNVTLTFTEPEFQHLVHLLAEASLRLATCSPLTRVRPH